MLLIIILILVTVMTFVSIARALFSKGVTSQVLRSSLGVQAQTLAESAVQEGLVRLRSRVNDPSDPIYLALRGEVYADQLGQFPIGLDLPVTEGLLEENPDFGSFELEEAGARVEFQKQFTSAPYERYGLLKVASRVGTDISFTDSVTRRVELGIEFKTHLLSTPRPFDQTAVYVQDGTSLLRDPYRRLDDAMGAIEDLRAEHDAMIVELDSRKDTVPFGRVMLARYEGIRIPPRDYWRDKAPELRPPASLFALGRDAAGVAVAELDVARRTEVAWDAVERTRENWRAARERVRSEFGNASRHDDYLDRLRILLGAYSELFGVMERFRNTFRVYDGSEHGELAPFAYKLGKIEWRRKATFDLDQDPQGRSPQEVFDELTGVPGRPVHGVFYTNSPGKTLRLRNRDVAGRVVLVAEGTRVEIENLNETARERDLFTVVSFGEVRVRGTNEVSLLALGALDISHDTKIRGNLIFDRVPTPERMAGRVAYQEKFHSGRTTASSTDGAFEDYYHVTLAPRAVYKSIERN